MTNEELDAIEARWMGFDAGLSVGVDAENECVIATQDNDDHIIATVHCDRAEQLAALWASAGPETAALVAEVRRLRALVDGHRAGLARAHAEGRAAGLREALGIVETFLHPSTSPEPTELDYIVDGIGRALRDTGGGA